MADSDYDLENTRCADYATQGGAPRSFDLGKMEVSGAPGLDAMFQREAHILRPPNTGRKKVASLRDISGFDRHSSETLIHRSNKDLWALKKEADGSYFIERLFDDNGAPIKG